MEKGKSLVDKIQRAFSLLTFSNMKYILEITVFTSGALVMIYEIVGSRLLAPYIGASTYVWTSLIGVILAALSLGYWLGGKLADRKPDIKFLASVIFLAGGLVSLTILLHDLILSIIGKFYVGLEVKSVIAALVLFAPASVFLGFVTPYAVKLKMNSLSDSGKTVGRLYALSTVGSILGTFLAGFFLIPFVGSVRTLYIVGGTLILLSILLVPFSFSRRKSLILLLFVFGIFSNETKSYILRQNHNFYDFDTEYSRVQVFNTTDKNGKEIRVLAIDPHFYQSKMYLDSDELASDYAKFYHLIQHFKPDFQKTLLIGGAGYSFPKDYLKKYDTAEIDVVEIDAQMTEIAKKYFRLEENPRLKIFHEDGRIFLNNSHSNKYDAVLMDAFGSLFSVPFQLTTVEAVQHINRVLKPDGVVIFNVGGAITGNSSKFVQAEIATYRRVFPRVLLFKVDSAKKDDEVQNLIIIATKEKNSAPLISDDTEFQTLFSNLYEKDLIIQTEILTDELAPVEYYNSFAQ